MEPDDKEELIKVRVALQRQLVVLDLISGRWRNTTGGALPIIRKLRSQIGEIDELLEGEGTGDAEGDSKDQIMAEDLRCVGCSKSSDDVRMLLAGLDWAICDECLSCLVAIAGERNREWRNEQIKALEKLNSN